MIAATSRPRRGAILLVVDDEPNVVSALSRLFRPHGYRVLTAASAEDALQVLSANKVDVVISDMKMPGIDGAALLQKVREQWPAAGRVMLTGYAELKTATDAIRRGDIDHVLTKPWEPDEIRQCIDRVLLDRANDRRV